MAHSKGFDHLIVGAGVAAAAAAKAIRERDPSASIGIVGREPDGPYYRPNLSKSLWFDDSTSLDDGWLLGDDDGIELITGVAATRLHPQTQVVSLSNAEQIGYEQLLLATGASPRTLPTLPPGDRVFYYRTVDDYQRLREVARPGSKAVVVGGGYIGAELAAALASNDVAVTLVIPTRTVQSNLFPPDLAKRVTETFRSRGVTVKAGARVMSGTATDGGVRLLTEAGATLTADYVVFGIGVTPNIKLAECAGLKTDGGIVVDEYLSTSVPGIWAAGDVAHYPDALLEMRRVEHVDNAEHQGARAGRNMVAATRRRTLKPYTYTPIFWSDLFDYGYEAVGEIDSSYATVEDFTPDLSSGVIYYLLDGHVRGVLLWNVWDATDKAKKLIGDTSARSIRASELKGRIPLG